ncbi:peptidase [Oceanobacillus piezotolerans]|uniref:Peptidase n=1 Tax=Oceanobacillus piezotolerans TaxID=2448030 RepID=A0A498D7D1_9BACI|nr:peptidase [Oceanobacillus piezotolerans]RLL43688.1 peptidase [Oceanobacillus piezotolerans]
MNLSIKSQLTLYPLTIRKDKKHYIVEEPLSGEYFEMPEICIDAIHLINNGESLEKIEKDLKQKYPAEEVDIIDFAGQLLELGLVKEVDGEEVSLTKKNQSPSGFTWIPSWMGRFFFNRITTKLYFAILCINILYFLSNPGLLPNYQDLFIFDSITLSLITYMAITLILIMIHEFGHAFAIRSYDLPANMNIGHRLLFVVFETDLSPAWKLSPKKRNMLYLGGMSFDQVMLFAALSIQLLFPESAPIVNSIAALVVLDIVIKTMYQCCFFMKTDLYYVFENVTSCYNLMESGKQYLSKWLPFIKTENTTEAFEGEAKVIRLYSIFYLFGLVLTFTIFIGYFLPQAIYAFSISIPNLLAPINSAAFWDAIVFLGQSLLMIGLLVYLKFRARVQ